MTGLLFSRELLHFLVFLKYVCLYVCHSIKEIEYSVPKKQDSLNMDALSFLVKRNRKQEQENGTGLGLLKKNGAKTNTFPMDYCVLLA